MELQSVAFRLYKQFENNHMKTNSGKSYILLGNKKAEKMKINNVLLTSSVEEKLLDITLDSELKFEKHISQSKNICSVQNYKLQVTE